MNDILVSVSVISYNSEKTILETLESIKSQTYQNIELIVSDDCSQDKTVEIAEKWIAENRERFARVELLTIDHNTGIPANANRALRACQGEWMKGIAADDVLLRNCITMCVKYINENPNISLLVGKTKKYHNIIDDEHLLSNDEFYSFKRLNDLNGDIETQKKAIMDYSFIEAPAVFIRTKVIKDVGGYDEQYHYLEDWPMWKKLIFSGYKCFFLNEEIVGYRQNANSVFSTTDKLFNFRCQESIYRFTKNELFQHQTFVFRTNKTLHYYICFLFDKFNMNNRRYINRKLYAFLCVLIDSLLSIK